MDVLILRLIHIGAGAFWVGSVFTFFLFVQPAAAAVGPDAMKFTYRLLHHQRLGVAILSAAVVTVLAGASLLVITSNGLDPDVLFSESRIGFTIGGVIAILTLGVGGLYVFPRTRTVERTIGGWPIRYGHYEVDGLSVWGATARILSQLGAVITRTAIPEDDLTR